MMKTSNGIVNISIAKFVVQLQVILVKLLLSLIIPIQKFVVSSQGGKYISLKGTLFGPPWETIQNGRYHIACSTCALLVVIDHSNPVGIKSRRQ